MIQKKKLQSGAYIEKTLLFLLLCAVLFTGCGNRISEDPEPAQLPPTSEPVIAEPEEKEPDVNLPTVLFSDTAVKDAVISLARSGESFSETDFLLASDFSEEEIQSLLDTSFPTNDLYTDYACESCSFDFTTETLGNTSVLHLRIMTIPRENTAAYEEVFFPAGYEDLYEIYLNNFNTGFEELVIAIPAGLDEKWVQYLVEEAVWHNSLNMPLLYKSTKPQKYYGSDGSYIMALTLDYEIYGITEEMQLEARELVREKVHSMAEEIRTLSMDPREQVGLVYDAVTGQVDFDYEVGDKLLDVETLNDQIIGVGRGIYGAAVTGKSVCTGYAALFHEICKELGIPSAILVGYAERGDHAWNMVLLDGEVAYFDPTWGDSKKWYKTYKFLSDSVNTSENRRVYDYEIYPQEFYDGGFDLPTAPMCLYD